MRLIAHLFSHVEVISPLGDRKVMPEEAYRELPLEQLRQSRARLVSRTEMLRAVARRKGASS